MDFGPDSKIDLEALELKWFDYWLKGIANGIVDEPPLHMFIMGENVWRDEQEWPLARTDWQQWQLHSAGTRTPCSATASFPAPRPPTSRPITSSTTPNTRSRRSAARCCCDGAIVPWAAQDQRDLEMRADVLCYSTPPLAEDLEVTGPITLTLYAATDGRDTDWTGKLVDVGTDGYAMILCQGIIRARSPGEHPPAIEICRMRSDPLSCDTLSKPVVTVAK